MYQKNQELAKKKKKKKKKKRYDVDSFQNNYSVFGGNDVIVSLANSKNSAVSETSTFQNCENLENEKYDLNSSLVENESNSLRNKFEMSQDCIKANDI